MSVSNKSALAQQLPASAAVHDSSKAADIPKFGAILPIYVTKPELREAIGILARGRKPPTITPTVNAIVAFAGAINQTFYQRVVLPDGRQGSKPADRPMTGLPALQTLLDGFGEQTVRALHIDRARADNIIKGISNPANRDTASQQWTWLKYISESRQIGRKATYQKSLER